LRHKGTCQHNAQVISRHNLIEYSQDNDRQYHLYIEPTMMMTKTRNLITYLLIDSWHSILNNAFVAKIMHRRDN